MHFALRVIQPVCVPCHLLETAIITLYIVTDQSNSCEGSSQNQWIQYKIDSSYVCIVWSPYTSIYHEDCDWFLCHPTMRGGSLSISNSPHLIWAEPFPQCSSLGHGHRSHQTKTRWIYVFYTCRGSVGSILKDTQVRIQTAGSMNWLRHQRFVKAHYFLLGCWHESSANLFFIISFIEEEQRLH